MFFYDRFLNRFCRNRYYNFKSGSITLTLILGLAIMATAQNIYWIAGASSNWNNPANWSATSGGSSCNCVPTNTSIVYFNGGATGGLDGNCILDVSPVVAALFITNPYNGTVDLNGNDLTMSSNSGSVPWCSLTNANIIDGVGTSDLSFISTGSGFSGDIKVLISGGSIQVGQDFIISLTGGNHASYRFINNATITTGNNLTATASNTYLDGATFNGNRATFKKITGGWADIYCAGGNVFNSITTEIVGGTSGTIYLANTNGDDFNGDVIFGCNVANGKILVAHQGNSTFAGNITVSASLNLTTSPPTGVSFGYGYLGATGIAILDGAGSQTISTNWSFFNNSPSPPGDPIIGKARILKASGNVTLNNRILVTGNLDMQSGLIHASGSANLVSFLDGATVTNVNDLSYITGRVYKTGNDPFTFPVGANGFYRPLAISAPATVTSQFYAQYLVTDAGNTSSFETSLNRVSASEHWLLDRTIGTDNVSVSLSWNENAFLTPSQFNLYINNLSDLRVAYWNGSLWADLGNSLTTGDETMGTITSAGSVTSFTQRKFTLASTTALNPLPVTLLSFSAIRSNDEVMLQWQTSSEHNNDHYIVERAEQRTQFKSIGSVEGNGTTMQTRKYKFSDQNPLQSRSYYRLKQMDYDGNFSYSKVIAVSESQGLSERNRLRIWPVPLAGSYLFLSETTDVFVLDNRGQIILAQENTNKLDVSHLPSGVYYVKNKDHQVLKFVRE
jgi:hypothetical protein